MKVLWIIVNFLYGYEYYNLGTGISISLINMFMKNRKIVFVSGLLGANSNAIRMFK